jgi:hypothetical protein
MAQSNVIKLTQAQTSDLLPLESRVAGTYNKELLIEGNSLLSTVFVKSVTGSVKANYHENTTGRDDGERKDLPSHNLITAANTLNPSKLLVGPFHNTPTLEVIVTGTAEFSVFATVVSSFATDLDNALQFDGEIADLLVDKGMPFQCYDEAKNKFFFLRCVDGVIPISLGEDGDPVKLRFNGTTTGLVQTLLSSTVAAATTRKIGVCRVSCRAHVEYEMIVDSVVVGGGFTSPTNPNDTIVFSPREIVPATKTVELKAKASSGPTGLSLRALIMANDLT